MSAFSPKESQPQQRTPSNTASPMASAQRTSFQQQHILNRQRTIGNQALLRMLQIGSKPCGTASTSATPVPGQHSFADTPIFSPSIRGIQPKLTVNTPGDAYEQEADRVAEQVMRMPEASTAAALASSAAPGVQRACACGGTCNECKKEHPEADHAQIQMKAATPSSTGHMEAPPIVHEALRSPGQPLDKETRAFMEPRFGHDFSGVRVHTDEKAAESARAVGARAYTVGSNVVFGAGEYGPGTQEGQRLLGHELTHVVQQGNAANGPLQRFHLPHGTHTGDESSAIAPTFADLLAGVMQVIKLSISYGNNVNMDDLVTNVGGLQSLAAVAASSFKQQPSKLKYRYVFTCRCGLIDMRHFIQLMYMTNFTASAFLSRGSRGATQKGREHELKSESESRFGAEDAPSNALGAFTGTKLAAYPQADDLYDEIKNTLTRCGPIDFKNLSTASQNTIKHFYADLVPDPTPKKAGDLIPKHQNESAVPDVLPIKECGGQERSFPFSLDTDDPDRKTIDDTAFEQGSRDLTKGSQMRDFIFTQRAEVIQALPSAEKMRLITKLASPKVYDSDIDAIEILYKNSTPAERTQIKSIVEMKELSNQLQVVRITVLFSGH